MTQKLNLPLALTMGDPAGIGGELTLKAWQKLKGRDIPFFVMDCPRRLKEISDKLALDVPIEVVEKPYDSLSCYKHALAVLPQELPQKSVVGVANSQNGVAVIESIKRAVEFVTQATASAVVTNPINKAVLYDAGFEYPGHTEYLAHLAGKKSSIMMLASKQLRVVPVTIHLSLQDAIKSLDAELIERTIRETNRSLKVDFGIAAPRIAVSGLNPHAGESGSMGREEVDLITPTLERLKSEGIDITGPLPADTMFHARAREAYDVAVCMYHDQALIPIKTLDFDQGVNVTLGLPFIRTSPDHGTAFDIAGKGIASPSSLIAAIELAAEMALTKQNAVS